jgi:hypothetical protein
VTAHRQAGRRRADRLQVAGDGHELAVGLRGERSLQPFVQLGQVDPAVTGRLAQDLGDALAVGVGDAHLRGFELTHVPTIGRQRRRATGSRSAPSLWGLRTA